LARNVVATFLIEKTSLMHTTRSYRMRWGRGLYKNGSGKYRVVLEMGTCKKDDEYLVCTKCG
jgi:hypothetical protein